MRRFVLDRSEDATGVSGTGVVAEGCLFANGKVTLVWLTLRSSVAVYDSLEDLEAIHGHGGRTVVRFLDPDDEAPLTVGRLALVIEWAWRSRGSDLPTDHLARAILEGLGMVQ